MGRIRLIRQAYLEELKASVDGNIEVYRTNDTAKLPQPESISFEIDLDADFHALEDLRPSNSHEDEVSNCLLVFETLKNITPELARDERLWAYILHYHALSYAASRWPIPEKREDAKAVILRHYFAGTKRGIERDNAISRLWWMAYIAGKSNTGSLQDNLNALLQFSDVRAAIVERPTVSRSARVLTAVMERLRISYNTYNETGDKGLFDRETFRRLMKAINAIGGYIILDALTDEQIRKLVSNALSSDT